jgi:hypothetical protein
MLFDGMMYLDYQTGDELIDIEAIINSDPLVGVKENTANSAFINGIAFPNPFNNSVTIRYLLTKTADVSIEITDLIGRKISSYNLGKEAEGSHDWVWDGKDVKGHKTSAGIYFYKLKANGFTSFHLSPSSVALYSCRLLVFSVLLLAILLLPL